MMMNLFSSFNPSSWLEMPLMWMSLPLITMLSTNKVWMINSKFNKMDNIVSKTMHKQFKMLMSKSMNMNILMMMAIMMMLALVNTSSMFPYIYSHSALPQFTLPLALSMWVAINMKKLESPINLMSKLLPKNTPSVLTPMMIMIETTSMMIQPITLSVRLMANITAGHILIILISSAYSIQTATPTLLTQLILSLMEICVSLIQAYVFAMLLIMFNK